MRNKYIVGLMLFILTWSCNSSFNHEEDYLQWIANEKNGLRKSKTTSVFEYNFQYLPPQYRAWQEFQNNSYFSSTQRDSILTNMEKSLYFVFTISPRHEKASGDVMYSKVNNLPDYQQRVKTLNFNFKDYWQLQSPKGNFTPVLSTLENTYSLSDYRKLHLVFATEDIQQSFYEMPHWDVIFNDEIFGTGIHHFVFWKDDWNNIPVINY